MIQVRRAADGTLELAASPGRELVDRFVDQATGYLVVCELDASTRAAHYAVVDQATGAIVPTAQRAAAAGEQVTVEAGLQLRVRRVVDLATGAEIFHESLVDLATGEVVGTRERMALTAAPPPSLVQDYLARAAAPSFWDGAYRAMSRADREAWWLRNALLQMRFQGEAGLDEYAMFTPDAYAAWKAHEPELDHMLDFVIEHLPDASARAEIDARTGRG